jgi:hypothetical protein
LRRDILRKRKRNNLAVDGELQERKKRGEWGKRKRNV